jgi:hypothetical protein
VTASRSTGTLQRAAIPAGGRCWPGGMPAGNFSATITSATSWLKRSPQPVSSTKPQLALALREHGAERDRVEPASARRYQAHSAFGVSPQSIPHLIDCNPVLGDITDDDLGGMLHS